MHIRTLNPARFDLLLQLHSEIENPGIQMKIQRRPVLTSKVLPLTRVGLCMQGG